MEIRWNGLGWEQDERNCHWRLSVQWNQNKTCLGVGVKLKLKLRTSSTAAAARGSAAGGSGVRCRGC
jgi:hypothetical protein